MTATLVVAALAAVVLTPAASWAQGAVVSTNPGDRAVLTTAPTTVDFSLDAATDQDLSHLSVRAADGSTVSSDTFVQTGQTTLSQPVTISTPGNYTVAYHIVFTNGDDIVGSFRFSVGTGVPPPAPDHNTILADESVVLQHDHGIDPVGGTLLAVDVAVLLGVVFLLIRRPSPRRASRRRWSATFPEAENPSRSP